MVARVLVGLGDDPGWGVGDAEVEDFAGGDEVVEALHELLHRGGVVPPVHVQQVDVVGLQLGQAGRERQAQRLGAVAAVVGLDEAVVAAVHVVVGGELGGQHDLVAIATRGHPLAHPLLRLLVLVVARRIDEVAASGEEVVQHLEGVVLGALAHHAGPAGVGCVSRYARERREEMCLTRPRRSSWRPGTTGRL